jgi:hypothetical protein
MFIFEREELYSIKTSIRLCQVPVWDCRKTGSHPERQMIYYPEKAVELFANIQR